MGIDEYNSDPYEDAYYADLDFGMPKPDGFELLESGGQPNGSIITFMGWENTHLNEILGIESFLGLHGFDSAKSFLTLIQERTGLSLNDWEPIEITLYECWYHYEGHNACHAAWRNEYDSSALTSTARTVFALRHKKFVSFEECAKFHVDRCISYKADIWRKHNPGTGEFTLDCFGEGSIAGYHITGHEPNSTETKMLTWPTHDLAFAIVSMDELCALGYTDLHVWQHEMGLADKTLNRADKERLICAYHNHGADSLLIDLASTAHIY